MRGGPPAPDRGLSTRSVSCSSVSRARRSFRWSLEDRFHRIPAQEEAKVVVRTGSLGLWHRGGSPHLLLFLKKIHLFFFLNSMCAHAWVYHKHTSTGTRGIQMWASDRLELELHAMMCCLMWVLGTECGSLGRAANTYSVSHHFSSWPHTFLA